MKNHFSLKGKKEKGKITRQTLNNFTIIKSITIILMYVSQLKKKYIYIYNFSCETYTKITVIDLIIVKLFRVCLVIFPLSFFHFKEK